MTTRIWPEEYGVAPDHCGDVLRGSYDVPFNPATPPVILDIGANVGAFTLWAFTRWPGCRIHSYEPHPKNYALLARTVQDRSLPATIHMCGIGDRPHIARMSIGPNNIGEHSIVFDYKTSKIPVQINPASTLPKADILKIDTEGCELRILTLLHDMGRLGEFSAVMMETHSEADRVEIMAMMQEDGFTITKDHRWHGARTELCYVRTDLLPADWSAPKKPLVWIMTPVRNLKDNGVISPDTFKNLAPHWRDPVHALYAAQELPWRFDIMLVGGGGVARARNKAVVDFLASDAEFLFMVDYDLQPTTEDYLEILTPLKARGYQDFYKRIWLF